MPSRRRVLLAAALAIVLSRVDPISPIVDVQSAQLDLIQYTFRVVNAAKHFAEIEARIPTGGQAAIDLMMPVWTPGY